MRRLSSIFLLFLLSTTFAYAGDVRIVSDPPDADVWQGGVLLGNTGTKGLLLSGLEPGRTVYSVRKLGYQPEDKAVDVTAGTDTATVLVRLKRELQEATPPAPAPSMPPPQKKGKGAKLALLVGGGAAAAVGVAVLASGKDPLEVDDDGDGVSEKAGDCNDRDQDIRPNGPVTFMLEPPFIGTVTCRQVAGDLLIRATNLSCQTVSISTILYARELTFGNCTVGTFSQNVPITQGTVPSGARNQTVGRTPGGHQAGCCRGFCSGGTCGFVDHVLVSTDRGNTDLSAPYQIQFVGCVLCSTAAVETGLAFCASEGSLR